MSSVFVSGNVWDAALVACVMMVAMGVYVGAKHVLVALVKKQSGEEKVSTRDEVILSVAKQNTTTATKRRNRNKTKRAAKNVASVPETTTTTTAVTPSQPTPSQVQYPATDIVVVTPVKPEAPAATPTHGAASSTKEDSYAAIATVAALAVMTDVSVTLQKPETTTIVSGAPRTPQTSEGPSFGDYYVIASEDSDMREETQPSIECDAEETDEALPPLVDDEDSRGWSLFSTVEEKAGEREGFDGMANPWNPLSDIFDSRKAMHGVVCAMSASCGSPRETLRDSSSCSIGTGSSRNSIFDEETASDTDSDDDTAPEQRVSTTPRDSPTDSHISSFFDRNLPLNSYQSPLFFPTAHGNIPLLPHVAVIA